MSKIHYVEVICQNETTAEIIDEQRGLNLQQFAQVCGQSPEWVLQLIDYDILLVEHPDQHQFLGEDVARARRAYRLQRDFDASLSAVALMLDLLDEVQQLRHAVRHLTPPSDQQTNRHEC